MNSPAPNIPCAISETSPFTAYLKELELEATSEDDIRAEDETLDAIFAEDLILILGVGGGAASAGCTAAMPQEGDDHLAAARAMTALSFVHDGQLKIDEATNPHPVCSGYEQGSADPQDADQNPPADEGKHATSKKTPFQSIIGCNDTGILLKKAPKTTKKERTKMVYNNAEALPKVSLIVAFFLNTTHCHHLKHRLNCAPSKSLSNSPSRVDIIPSKTAW